MSYLQVTRNEMLTLKADSEYIVKWWVDASFAVHPDMRSHTGAIMTLGQGAIQSISTKQKVNTRSLTEAELVAVDNTIAQILWTKKILKAQGVSIKDRILYQDNQSTILLAKNGRASAGKHMRHLNIRYFFITDQLERKLLKMEFCPTDQMKGDYMSNPVQGGKFAQFKKWIMNQE